MFAAGSDSTGVNLPWCVDFVEAFVAPVVLLVLLALCSGHP